MTTEIERRADDKCFVQRWEEKMTRKRMRKKERKVNEWRMDERERQDRTSITNSNDDLKSEVGSLCLCSEVVCALGTFRVTAKNKTNNRVKDQEMVLIVIVAYQLSQSLTLN
jgi:hypothetical protein